MAPRRTLAAVGREVAEQQPQQRRLPGAVGTDQPDAVAAQNPRREVTHDDRAVVRLADPFGLEDQPSRGVGPLDPQADRADGRAPRGALLAHRHQRAHPALVARAPRLDALPQPHFFLRQTLVELVLLATPSLASHSSFFLHEGGIVARPGRQRAAIDLDNARGEPLQERAVVRDEDERAAVVRQKALEPGDGVDVQVIGRLVEQQHVGLGHQRARQQHPPPPAARQRVDARVGRQVETRQDQIDLVLALPVFEVVAPGSRSSPSATTSKTERAAVSGTSWTSRAIRSPG